MQFWDTSAIVPLLVEEDSTADIRELHGDDPHIIASWLTPIEVTSALWRRRHTRTISAEQHAFADIRFARLSTRWSHVTAIAEVRSAAIDLLSRHHLRAGDAIQLASALIVADGIPTALPFVTLDRDLATAARAEGFSVLP